eukprot:CAMPEP_0179003118 /NCGR_PEP_ID=MMETSP0795-20121207/12461_1 /TAXON_ID=88552 /ORGANISM="Amoebophrya sp., Strain Ameob2" /LENGTH=245 /DNA_ID=CAMNT_0020697013 /DNA_START=50 /DNA_END=788 /DNA_ORIENTATION=+
MASIVSEIIPDLVWVTDAETAAKESAVVTEYGFTHIVNATGAKAAKKFSEVKYLDVSLQDDDPAYQDSLHAYCEHASSVFHRVFDWIVTPSADPKRVLIYDSLGNTTSSHAGAIAIAFLIKFDATHYGCRPYSAYEFVQSGRKIVSVDSRLLSAVLDWGEHVKKEEISITQREEHASEWQIEEAKMKAAIASGSFGKEDAGGGAGAGAAARTGAGFDEGDVTAARQEEGGFAAAARRRRLRYERC